MPEYIAQALHKFKHLLAQKQEDAPHKWNQPSYGAKKQFSNPVDQSLRLPASDIKHVQTVVGTLIYYALAVDNAMLVALGDLASEQTEGTQKLSTTSHSYSITPPHIPTQPFSTAKAIWCSTSTVTAPTYPPLRLEIALEDIFSCPRIPLIPPNAHAMVPFM